MKPKSVTLHPDLIRHPFSQNFKGARVSKKSPMLTDYRQGKRHLFISPKKGDIFHICASLDTRYICCSTHVISHISNCPFECTYCFLQNYLTDTTLTVVADTKAIMAEIKDKVAKQPWRFFRIGTWELGDSLALPPLNQMAATLVKEFALTKNCVLKLRTKSSAVEPLMDLDHQGKTVVSWTLNPPEIIAKEEIATAPLEKRLMAMEKVARCGYPIGLHFDPMILFNGWQNAYEGLIKMVFSAVRPKDVIWISVGSLRFNPEMKKKIENNYPSSKITAQELVLGDDNKFRYPRPVRQDMYSLILDCLKNVGADQCFTYLCMERWNVWERVFGRYPVSIGHLDYLIARSVHKRFPKTCPTMPPKGKYMALSY